MSELYDRVSAGGVSFEEITEAISTATSEGGMFYQSMEKQSQTLNGQLSTLKDNIQIKLGEAFSSVSDKLATEIIPKINEFIGSLDVEEVIAWFTQFIETLGFLLAAFISITSAVKAYQLAMATLSIINAIKSATEGMTIAQIALNLAMKANPIAIVVSAIVALITWIGYLLLTSEDFRNWASGVFGIFENIIGVIADMIGWIGDLIGWLGKLFGMTSDVSDTLNGVTAEMSAQGYYIDEYGFTVQNTTGTPRSTGTESITTYNNYDVSIDAESVDEFNDIVQMSNDQQIDTRMGG